MKFALSFTCALFIGATTSLYSQNAPFTFSVKEKTIKDVFRLIEEKSQYRFLYNDDFTDLNRTVTIDVKESRIENVLDKILNKSEITYRILDNNLIVITPAETFRQQLIITGIVTDETGKPMTGANVAVKGSATGTTTGANGRYRITVPSADAVLTFNFIGYSEQTILVGNRIVINVTMKEGALELSDVVVNIGYGANIRSRDITGSVTLADMAEIQKMPVSSAMDGLAGRISGVQVISADGTPGQSSDVVIRGGNSITGNNNPLYVVDGFPQGEDFDLGTLDPSQIESLVVLKDASSTAIYGSRGANGVIMITMKGGVIGKPEIIYSGFLGVDVITKQIEVMSPYEFVRMEYERDQEAATRTYLKNRTLESYKDDPGVNWQNLLFRKALTQTHTLSIRGGTEQTKYNFSAGYVDQDGLIIESNYKRYNGRMILDQQLYRWLKGGVGASYSSHIYAGARPSSSEGWAASHYMMFSAWGMMPVSETGEDLLDVFIDPNIDPNTDYRVNPIISTKNEYKRRYKDVLTASAYLDFKIADHLFFKTIGQMYRTWQKDVQFNNSLTRSGHPRGRNGVNGSLSSSESLSFVNESILTYSNTFKRKHELNATGALTFEKGGYSSHGFSSRYIPNEEKGISGIDEGEITGTSSFIDPGTQRMSFLGRAIYNFNRVYMATVSMRADGSSRFAKGNRWGYFPSASLAWQFGKEKFLLGQKILSNGKLRASWGLTGNDRIRNSARFAQMVTPANQRYPINNEYVVTSYIGYPGNPDLRWEKTEQMDLGLDLDFLRGKLALVLDVYRKNTTDLLLEAGMPGSSGFRSMSMNVGQMRNQGLEVELKSVNIKRKSFEWRTHFNIAFNRNEIIALAYDQASILRTVTWHSSFNAIAPYISVVGGPTGQIYGYVFDGLYQPADFNYNLNGTPALKPGIPTHSTTNQPGDVKYRDVNGDGVVNDQDRQVIGNTQPKHLGGINNMFRYKNFDLSVFFRWSYGNDVLNANRIMMEGGGARKVNQFATFVNRWTFDNQNTNMPRLNSNGGPSYSSRLVEDASFLRFQTISFGYSAPGAWLKKASIDKLRLSLAMNNIFVWTKYSGFDPEVSSVHSPLTPGFDYSTYPRARTVTLTLNLTFKP